jgi:hypothetical protein
MSESDELSCIYRNGFNPISIHADDGGFPVPDHLIGGEGRTHSNEVTVNGYANMRTLAVEGCAFYLRESYALEGFSSHCCYRRGLALFEVPVPTGTAANLTRKLLLCQYGHTSG